MGGLGTDVAGQDREILDGTLPPVAEGLPQARRKRLLRSVSWYDVKFSSVPAAICVFPVRPTIVVNW